MKLLHVRHATSVLQYGGLRFLIDPVLAEKEVYPPIPMTPNQRMNPLVKLDTPMETLLSTDVVLATHTHFDHFDPVAVQLLDKNKPLICQDTDVEKFTGYGFTHLLPMTNTLTYGGVQIVKVRAQHGFGATGELMGHTSGFILSTEHEPTVYFTGDTVYNDSIKENISHYKPDVLVMNAGSPKFLESEHIVMNIADLESTMSINPKLAFVVVHLDTYNHCVETRSDIRNYFSAERLKDMGIDKFFIPFDNEVLTF